MVNRVLKQRLGINEPTVSLGSTTLFEEGDGADERLHVNLDKLLKVRCWWCARAVLSGVGWLVLVVLGCVLRCCEAFAVVSV